VVFVSCFGSVRWLLPCAIPAPFKTHGLRKSISSRSIPKYHQRNHGWSHPIHLVTFRLKKIVEKSLREGAILFT